MVSSLKLYSFSVRHRYGVNSLAEEKTRTYPDLGSYEILKVCDKINFGSPIRFEKFAGHKSRMARAAVAAESLLDTSRGGCESGHRWPRPPTGGRDRQACGTQTIRLRYFRRVPDLRDRRACVDPNARNVCGCGRARINFVQYDSRGISAGRVCSS